MDHAPLRDDLASLLAQYSGHGLGVISLRTAIGDVMEVARRHSLTIPRDLALLLKTLIMEEGMAAQLDPDFRLVEALRPYTYRDLVGQLSPAALAKRLERLGIDSAELAIDLPGQLHRLLEVFARGDLEVDVRATELDGLMTRSERVGKRLAGSVIAAAAIVGATQLAIGTRRPARKERIRRR